MAAGIPILATDIPGNRELLQPGKSAWFVPVENKDELAQGMITAYQNLERNIEFSQKASENVKLFEIEHIAKKHEMLYQFIQLNKRAINRHNHKNTDSQIDHLINDH